MKIIPIVLLAFVSLNLDAQVISTGPAEYYLSLEVDPAPFILGGYSFSLKFAPKRNLHISYMASVYSSEFPDGMMSSENHVKGFRNLKIETSYAAFADYFLKGDKTGLHFGPSLFVYSKSVGLSNNSSRADFTSLYPNVRIGYVYKPFQKIGVYVNPWVNFGKEFSIGNDNIVEGMAYSPATYSYIVAVHLGYKIPL